jgi:hypothetical protein
VRFDRIRAQPLAHDAGGVALWLQFGDDVFWVDATTRLVSPEFAVVAGDVMYAAESLCRRHGHELAERVQVAWLELAALPKRGPFTEPPADALRRTRSTWTMTRAGRTSSYGVDWRMAHRARPAVASRAAAPPL